RLYSTWVMPSLIWPLSSGPICVPTAPNLWMHHLYTITAPPGLADDLPVTDPAKSQRAEAAYSGHRRRPPRRGELAGVRWSN
ncbi:hypothetical protein B0H14DRAFT_3078527, partial [Mycena olivaceomarginata]